MIHFPGLLTEKPQVKDLSKIVKRCYSAVSKDR